MISILGLTWLSQTQLPFFQQKTKYIAVPLLNHRMYIKAKLYHKYSNTHVGYYNSYIKYGRLLNNMWWYYNIFSSKYQNDYERDLGSQENETLSTFIKLCNATFISMPHHYTEFDSFKFLEPKFCQLKKKTFENFYCFLISSSKMRSYFLILSSNGAVTWIEADQMCKTIGGFLPFFNQRKDLNDLLYTVRFAKAIPLIQNTYIGLRYNKVGELLHN